VLQTACQAQYLTRAVESMRRVDFDATHMVKAVKGLSLSANAYTDIPIDGKTIRIVEANKDRAIDWHASWAASKIAALGDGRKILIPVPSSKTTLASPDTFRTMLIAKAIEARVPNSFTLSALRFKEARPSSREDGGSRDPDVLCKNLAFLMAIPIGKIILIDDVMTSGGHFVACAWKLEERFKTVDLALACGRSMETRLDDPWQVPPESVDIAKKQKIA
jgi:hypothetical protein